MWAIKKLNLDWGTVSNQRMSDLNELDEFCLRAYESCASFRASSSPSGPGHSESRNYSHMEWWNFRTVRKQCSR
ncbi:hypothetical protein RDI58_010609 [Solanum bulbocastanum]|uniref:Uncharacterized protein n=1 Tax=Solanum bulbocastanum TaxID=147425 RepID=A0AAN8TV44_SOLBU